MNDLATDLLGPASRAADRVAQAAPQSWAHIGCPFSFTILGQPCSKGNSYHIVTLGKRPAIVKSKEALAYVRSALLQIPPAFRLRLEGPVAVTMRLWYASERPDLDASIVLDVLQDRWSPAGTARQMGIERVLLQSGVYRNDRQVRELHLHHGIDRANPRAEITIQPLLAQQEPLF